LMRRFEPRSITIRFSPATKPAAVGAKRQQEECHCIACLQQASSPDESDSSGFRFVAWLQAAFAPSPAAPFIDRCRDEQDFALVALVLRPASSADDLPPGSANQTPLPCASERLPFARSAPAIGVEVLRPLDERTNPAAGIGDVRTWGLPFMRS